MVCLLVQEALALLCAWPHNASICLVLIEHRSESTGAGCNCDTYHFSSTFLTELQGEARRKCPEYQWIDRVLLGSITILSTGEAVIRPFDI